MSQNERLAGPPALTHQERARYMSEAVVSTAAVLKPLFDGFDPRCLDYDALRAKIGDTGQDAGLKSLYYSGMYVWLALRERLPDQDVGGAFQGLGRLAVENYMFRSKPHTFIEGQLQSTFSAASILAAWTVMSSRGQPPAKWERAAIGEAPAAAVIDMLRSDWFPELLRAASVTSSGLYRNSTGIALDYKGFSLRSIIGPLRQFHEAVQDGGFPVEPIPGATGGRTGARLSGRFEAFLRQRLRDHNAGIDPGAPLHDGASSGCPFAHPVHVASDASRLTPEIGHVDGSPRGDGRFRVHIDWDPHRQICGILANVLEHLQDTAPSQTA